MTVNNGYRLIGSSITRGLRLRMRRGLWKLSSATSRHKVARKVAGKSKFESWRETEIRVQNYDFPS